MPYFQEGRHVYWWDPDRRQHRSVGPGDRTPTPAPVRRGLNNTESDSPEPPVDPHHVRDTTVRGPGD